MTSDCLTQTGSWRMAIKVAIKTATKFRGPLLGDRLRLDQGQHAGRAAGGSGHARRADNNGGSGWRQVGEVGRAFETPTVGTEPANVDWKISGTARV